jgi:hypothetical protein
MRKEALNLQVPLVKMDSFGRVSVQLLWQAVKSVFKLAEDLPQ